ncbi:hypothetical protein CC1G_09395 [Coprinopsis cinerea okayama7|uniref:2OGFeDO JBP1/TET oxygenase domain-containing protein n=1 Tax=Coprinopsis cinerea (strain Okayama-7 / 130 / ATCC MYA-4618 / FGSC 9003) TaxID=240176 RepID=A8NB35_COPC7|nr:hypothetical protein CC1G_09395 [Coprinopsis cinerea okayama7\|eukprot:XP_001832037.2 hypothetical protein CC1G_09395 [Coprinopsis cinerea okayama7\
MDPSDTLPPAIKKLMILASYTQQLVREKLHPQLSPSQPPPGLSLQLQSEARLIAACLCKALDNPLQLKWTTNTYMENRHKKRSTLETLCPPFVDSNGPPNSVLRDEPFLVIDLSGRVVMCYLPSVICKERQAIIREAITWLSNVPQVPPLTQKPDGNFRVNPGKFSPSTTDIRSGVVTYASTWPMAGHPDGPWAPSANFKNPKGGGLSFLEMISESLAVLGAILAVIHPALFEAGVEVLSRLNSGYIEVRDYDLLKQVLNHWSSPFTAFSVITNRQTDLHRDSLSPTDAFDMLYTSGDYDDGRFEVPGLGIRCRYDPGTVIALLTAVFEHGVPRQWFTHLYRPFLPQSDAIAKSLPEGPKKHYF